MTEEVRHKRNLWIRLWVNIDTIVKITATFVALIAVASFLVPPIRTLVNVITAWRFGATGYVYYGIKADLTPTEGGQLFLLRGGAVDFEDLGWGDRLQAVSLKEFREAPASGSRRIFQLSKGDCLVVLAKEPAITDKDRLQDATSGGWLWVATTACGLFSK